MTRVFFYGLFMDQTLLTGKGLHPDVIGPAALPDYRIHIGERATLLPSPGRRAYGIVMSLTDEEARALYAEPSVSEYIPELVRAEMMGFGETVEALCYNLPPDLALAGTSPGYANRLARLLDSLGFDSAYIQEVAAFGGSGGSTHDANQEVT